MSKKKSKRENSLGTSQFVLGALADMKDPASKVKMDFKNKKITVIGKKYILVIGEK